MNKKYNLANLQSDHLCCLPPSCSENLHRVTSRKVQMEWTKVPIVKMELPGFGSEDAGVKLSDGAFQSYLGS